MDACGNMIRRYRVRYFGVVAVLCLVGWVTYWLKFMPSEQSELEKLYYKQENEVMHHNDMPVDRNHKLPSLHHVQRESPELQHQGLVKPQQSKFHRAFHIADSHPNNMDNEQDSEHAKPKKFPNIVENQYNIHEQLGLKQGDLEALQKKNQQLLLGEHKNAAEKVDDQLQREPNPNNNNLAEIKVVQEHHQLEQKQEHQLDRPSVVHQPAEEHDRAVDQTVDEKQSLNPHPEVSEKENVNKDHLKVPHVVGDHLVSFVKEQNRQQQEQGSKIAAANPGNIKPGVAESYVNGAAAQMLADHGRVHGGYVLVHGGQASIAPTDKPLDMAPLPENVPTEAYVFESDSLPSDVRFRPSVGNGHLATTVHNKNVFLNGFYNGNKNQTHRAEIPSTVCVRFKETLPPTTCSRKHVLNVGKGVYEESCSHELYKVTQRIFAHRSIPDLLVTEIDLTVSSSYSVQLQLELTRWATSYDITFRLQQLDIPEASLKVGTISSPEETSMSYDEVYILYDHIPDTLTPLEGSARTKWVYLTAIGRTKQEVLDTYHQGSSLIHSGDQLYMSHVRAWADLWASGYINIPNNLDLSRAAFGSWYSILSSIPLQEHPQQPFIGLSPSGLPLGSFDSPEDYQGQILWDQELWVFPAVTSFYPDLAKLLLKSRNRFLAKKSAAQLAQQNNYNHSLQYPWRCALSGQELSERSDPHRNSAYVSGLVSFAINLYLDSTNNTAVIMDDKNMYGETLLGIANYYSNLVRPSVNDVSTLSITGVQPPDIFAKSVDDSAFVNSVAGLALSVPHDIFRRINVNISLELKSLADKLLIPFDSQAKYHLEHSNYNPGSPVSQADVVLLGYPLMKPMLPEIRRNDLEIYEKMLDPKAPATSWAMHAIGWLEVGELERAQQAFNRQFSYLKDFQIWTEKASTEGASNYLGAAGAYLQSLTQGYLGLRYHSDHLYINPVLPPGAESMEFIGVGYLQSSIDFQVWLDTVTVRVTARGQTGPSLKIITLDPPKAQDLKVGHSVIIGRVKAVVVLENALLPDELS